MQKATLVEVGTFIAFGAVAASLAAQLHARDVSVAAIVAVIAFTVTTGASLAQSIGQAMRTTLYTCPAKGCTVSIRAQGTSPDELDRLRALATDHTQHGSTR
ncbi:hypothetical protein SUDANB145_07231 (plasmid) [Streptomyces sp. enrichment culture]|uniref:hypothetical protein n=1 Tax=Streptomyces sp. enrichment culture TaxID=1795815 RepID=UPI003F5569F5